MRAGGRVRQRWRIVLLLAAACVGGLAHADVTLDRARALLAASQPRHALDTLLPLEPQRAGDPAFDYLLGIAAIDAGEPERAVFALERVLALEPDNLQARAEIARAYLLLGERASAAREFAAVRAQPVPDAVRATIDRYLSALAPESRGWRAYVETMLGHDSNINVATARTTIALPGAGGSIGVLNPAAVRQGSGFFGAAAAASYVHPMTQRWAWVAAGTAAAKLNFSGDDFDALTLDGSFGIRWREGAHTMQVGWLGQAFRLDRQRYRDTNGAVVQWQWAIAAATEVSAFGQYARLGYPAPGQRFRDADRAVGGVALAHRFALPFEPYVFASVYGGSERTRDDGFSYLGHVPIGARVGGQVSTTASTLLFVSASHEQRRYRGTHPLFLARREDDQLDLRIGLAWRFAADWSVTPAVNYTRNDSSIELFAYTRTLASVTLRRDF